MSRGVFITFEGGEGTGKSTQIKRLQESLTTAGVKVIATREPGGTPQAERIRDLLLQRDSGAFDPMTEALLLSAARREHLVQKIWPSLEAGQWVLSDRFADSTRAYQGAGMGLDVAAIETLYKTIAGNFAPDLTLVFDIDPEVGLKRSLKRQQGAGVTEDRYENMELDLHRRLRAGYLDIAAKNPQRCVVVDAAQSMEDVQARVRDIVRKKFNV